MTDVYEHTDNNINSNGNIKNSIYDATDYLNWNINSGEKTIHARRIKGRYRNRYNSLVFILYGLFFLLPYVNWGNRQAILLDIPNRKFYLFDAVVWPQDLWMLALLLLFCFVLLFAMTSVYGRIFCGFVCPQTVWTGIFTYIENFVEGPPSRRVKLDMAPWSINKIATKITKHFLWLIVCIFTGVTFIGYFSGIYASWQNLFGFGFSSYEWVTIIFVTNLFYMNCGFVREQVCLWVCPYARIQAVITDSYTRMVTYIKSRGEPRNRLLKSTSTDSNSGDCIDCKMCLAACPTGVDIRGGQQLGCINCGFCIDACDSVMKKIGRATGLITFTSQQELNKKTGIKSPFLRSRPIFYSTLSMAIFTGIMLGLVMKSTVDINVRHERSPVYTVMSDGSIQNIYHVKLLNKTEQDNEFKLDIKGIDSAKSNASNKIFYLKSGQIKRFTLRVRTARKNIASERQDVLIILSAIHDPDIHAEYKSMFIAPKLNKISRL